ncbi:protein kinase [Rostrohypoxylon terebratum]|nr:protein kinase [Rostrohypoxylon terebratum]
MTPNLLSHANTAKRLGLYDSERVRRVTDRGESDFSSSCAYSPREDFGPEIESNSANPETQVGRALDDAKVRSALDSTKKYIPRHKILQILTPEKIQNILNSRYFENYSNKDELAECVLRGSGRLKLLAVLIGSRMVQDLPKYIADGVDDQCFPMILDTSDRAFCRKHNKCHETLDAYDRSYDREQFSSWSYSLSAPYISYNPNVHSHYVLDPGDIFPVTGEKIRKKAITGTRGASTMAPLPPDVNSHGGFSEVYRVKIEKSHYDFGTLGIRHPDGYFALKKLNNNNEEEFNMELSSLLFSMDRASGKTASKHLIQLLATFEVIDPYSGTKCPTYYLLFDWAEGNLPQFWKAKEKEYVGNKDHCLWMSQQFHEICLALQSVHNEREKTLMKFIDDNPEVDSGAGPNNVHDLYGRHGDIKPDNFLWFRPEKSPDLLALSDFGLGRLHTQVSRSNQNPKDIARTATYIAPEFDLKDGRISRASDVYSLGCVFLEHVTWFLQGYDSVINDFPKFRNDKDVYPGWESDKFFMIQVDEQSGTQTPIMKPQVQKWISELQQHKNCSGYLHKLLDIIGDKMLEPERAKRVDIASLSSEMEILRKRCEGDESFYSAPKSKL